MTNEEIKLILDEQKRKRKRTVTIILAVFFGFVALGVFSAIISPDKPEAAPQATAVAAETVATPTTPAPVVEASNWDYTEDIDKMEGNTRFFASCTSTNTIEFEFPYNGGSTFWIVVRNMGQGNEAMLKVSKGQFIGSYDGSESIKVKFDENKPISYSYNEPSDGSSNVIFLNNSSDFIRRLKSSKNVLIAATFFDAGTHHIEFKTDGLTWKH